MTVVSPENKQETENKQDKIDATLPQQKPEVNLQQQPTEQKKDEPAEDPNWRAFREARKKDRADREAAERRAAEKEAEALALRAAMEAAFAKGNSPYPTQNQNVEYEETEDQKIEKKVNTILAQREAAAEKTRLERERQEYPQRLVQSYPDFNNVITDENLAYMDYHHPEISRPLNRLQDSFDKWSDIYHVIKKFVPNNSTAKKEAARADMNQNRPKSASTTSITQPGEGINRSSMHEIEQRRSLRYAEMQRIMKGV